MITQWVEDNKRLIAGIVMLATIIWGIIYICVSLGAFAPDVEAYNDTKELYEAARSYASFVLKVEAFKIPLLICCLTLIPLYNDDDKIISVISLGMAIICLIITLFTDSSINAFFSNLLTLDLILSLLYVVRTSSSVHRVFKIIVFAIAAVYVFMANPISGKNKSFDINDMDTWDYYEEYSKMSEKEKEAEKAKQNFIEALFLIVEIGIIINPGLAVILDDGTGYLGGGTPDYDRKESPLEMYNRLVSQGQSPVPAGTPGAPVAVAPVPAPQTVPGPQVGPNSGAVVNPLVPPAPAQPAPQPAPAAPEQSAEQFEVPQAMAFLFDENTNQDNSNK